MTRGLIARDVNGIVKIFDVETNLEVTDIAKHQLEQAHKAPNYAPVAGFAAIRAAAAVVSRKVTQEIGW